MTARNKRLVQNCPGTRRQVSTVVPSNALDEAQENPVAADSSSDTQTPTGSWRRKTSQTISSSSSSFSSSCWSRNPRQDVARSVELELPLQLLGSAVGLGSSSSSSSSYCYCSSFLLEASAWTVKKERAEASQRHRGGHVTDRDCRILRPGDLRERRQPRPPERCLLSP